MGADETKTPLASVPPAPTAAISTPSISTPPGAKEATPSQPMVTPSPAKMPDMGLSEKSKLEAEKMKDIPATSAELSTSKPTELVKPKETISIKTVDTKIEAPVVAPRKGPNQLWTRFEKIHKDLDTLVSDVEKYANSMPAEKENIKDQALNQLGMFLADLIRYLERISGEKLLDIDALEALEAAEAPMYPQKPASPTPTNPQSPAPKKPATMPEPTIVPAPVSSRPMKPGPDMTSATMPEPANTAQAPSMMQNPMPVAMTPPTAPQQQAAPSQEGPKPNTMQKTEMAAAPSTPSTMQQPMPVVMTPPTAPQQQAAPNQEGPKTNTMQKISEMATAPSTPSMMQQQPMPVAMAPQQVALNQEGPRPNNPQKVSAMSAAKNDTPSNSSMNSEKKNQ